MLIFPVLLDDPGGYRVHRLALSRGDEPLDHAVHLVVVPRPYLKPAQISRRIIISEAGQDVEEEEVEVILVG